MCYKMQHHGQLQEIIITVIDKGAVLLESGDIACRQASGKEDKSSIEQKAGSNLERN